MSAPTNAAASQQPEVPPQQLLLQAATGYMVSSAVNVAVRLNIADRLAAGPKSVAALARETGTDDASLYRLLRALASVGIFSEVAGTEHQFALTPAAELLVSGRPGSMRDFVNFIADPFHLKLYAEMMHSIETGKPALDHMYGKAAFEFFADPAQKDESDSFNAAMTSFSAQVVPAVLDAYDFSGIGTLMDVAGGHGYLLTEILKKYPAMKGVLVDMEHVVPGAQDRIQSGGLSGRCSACAGDFFVSLPGGADAIIMKHIVHDWDDDRATALLKNCRKALSAGGKLLLVEAVITENNAPQPGKFVDLEMMIFPGGKERTEREYRKLLAESGFELKRVVKTKSPLDVVEAVAK